MTLAKLHESLAADAAENARYWLSDARTAARLSDAMPARLARYVLIQARGAAEACATGRESFTPRRAWFETAQRLETLADVLTQASSDASAGTWLRAFYALAALQGPQSERNAALLDLIELLVAAPE